MFKRSLVSLAVAAGLGVASQAGAAPVVFDTQTGGQVIFNNMTWQGGNALAIGALSTPVTIDTNGDGIADSQLLHTVAQARLSSFQLTNGGNFSYPAGVEITYQADFWEIATGIGGPTAAFTLATFMPSSLKMYYDANPATFGDATTGNNFGADPGAVKILEGTMTSLTGNYTDFTRLLATAFPVKPLDCDAGASGCVGFDGVDQAPGTRTNQGNGNNQITVDVTFQDNTFFKSNVSSLTIDLSQVLGASVPFQNSNPWVNIVGQTPVFSLTPTGRINGADCVNNIAAPGVPIGQQQDGTIVVGRCDQLLQTTGLTTFNVVPEPGSLALVGLGLAGLGGFARRRRQQA